MTAEENKEPAFKSMTWADIQDAAPESAESAYRRGYRDGWIQAVDALHDLMFQDRMSRQDAYNKAWNHWEWDLLEWERKHKEGFDAPPGVKRGK